MSRRWVLLIVGVWLLTGQSLFGQVNTGRPAAKPVPTQRLIGFLKGKSEERRAEAIALLDAATVQQAGIADALRESVERDMRSKHVSLLTFQSLSRLAMSSRDEDIQFLTKLTEAADVNVAFVAAASLAERKEPQLLPAIVSLAKRKEFTQSYGFRRCLVDAVAQVPDKAAVVFLIEMATKFDGQLRDLCIKEGVGVIVYYSLASGFLSGKYRSKADLKGRARDGAVAKHMTERGFRILDALDAVAKAHDAKPAEVALAWLIAREGVTAPIASATSVEQVDSLVRASQLELTAAEIKALTSASAA